MSTRTSQAQRILKLLYSRRGWVTAWRLSGISLCYTRRISELKAMGHVIELRDEWTGRQRRTAYRLASKKA
jgi:hypothetical protein